MSNFSMEYIGYDKYRRIHNILSSPIRCMSNVKCRIMKYHSGPIFAVIIYGQYGGRTIQYSEKNIILGHSLSGPLQV